MQKIDSPFPGLRYFSADESELFFGREGQSDELARKLENVRLVAVVGTSGSGKSSLVRAGLLPLLEEGSLVKLGSHWRLVDTQPGSRPIANLAKSLQAAGLSPSAAEVEALGSNSLALRHLVRQAYRDGRLDRDEKLLVLVDQFEELFRYESSAESPRERDEKAIFVKLLLELARQQDPTAFVIITMRSDFLGDCARFRDLPEAINAGQYLIPRMTRDERRKAIEGPVYMGSGDIAQRLVQRILNDVGEDPDQLPVMQHALMRTWHHWRDRAVATAQMDIDDYEAIGTLENALSQHADEAYAEVCTKLPGSGAELVKHIFQRLRERDASMREIRRPTILRELCAVTGASEDDVRTALECFRREGRSFLIPPMKVELTPGTAIDITHESLLRQWKRLQGPVTDDSGWLAEEEESRRMLLRLADRAVEQQASEDPLYLREPLLQLALDWREKQRPTPAWAERYTPYLADVESLLDASRNHRAWELQEKENRAQAEQLAREQQIRADEERARKDQLAAAEKRRKEQKARWLWAVVVGSVLISVAMLYVTWTAVHRQKELTKLDGVLGERDAELKKETILAQAQSTEAQTQARNAITSAAQASVSAALAQSNEDAARASALEALKEKKLADAALVSVGAQNILSDQPDLALLLTVQANRNADTASTKNGLLKAIESVPHLRILIRGHANPISGLAFRNNTLYSLDSGGILLKDTTDGADSGQPVTARSGGTLSANAQYIMSTENFLPARIWNLDSGAAIRSLPKRQGPVAMSGDGKVIAGFSDKDHRSIQFWNIDKATAAAAPIAFSDPMYPSSIALSQNGSRLAIATTAGDVTLYDLANSANPAAKTLLQKSETCSTILAGYALAFDAHTSYLAGGCPSGQSISLWDIRSKSPVLQSFVQHNGSARLAFSADGKYLASGSPTGVVTLFSIANGFMIQRWSEKADSASVGALSFSADSKTLASSGKAIALWNIDQQALARMSPDVDPIYYLPLSLMNLAFTGNGQLATLGLTATPNNPASPGSRTPAQGSAPAPMQFQYQLSARTRSLPALTLRDTKNVGSMLNLSQATLSPDGATVAVITVPDRAPNSTPGVSSGMNGMEDDKVNCRMKLQLYSSTGALLPDPMAGEGSRGVLQIAFSPNSRELAIASCEDSGKGTSPHFAIKRWDLIGHTAVGTVPVKDEPTALALSSDNRLLAAAIGHDKAEVEVWNLDSNKKQELQTKASRYSALLFSPDSSQRLLAADVEGNLTISSVDDGKLQARLKNPSPVFTMSFTRDGKTVAAGGSDGSITLYETERLQTFGTLPRSGGFGPAAVTFNPENSTMLASDVGGAITLWTIDPAAWRKLACRVANRNLNWDEWQQYSHSDGPLQQTCDDLPIKPSLIQAAKDSLRQGDSRTALTILKRIQQLQPGGGFDPQKELARLEDSDSAQDVVKRATMKTQTDPLGALSDLRRALALDKSIDIPADSWAEICAYGSAAGSAATVMQACEAAVAAAPNNVDSLASRGVARALTNNLSGAIQDFEAALNASDAESIDTETSDLLRNWIDVLKTGKNPITPEVLQKLMK